MSEAVELVRALKNDYEQALDVIDGGARTPSEPDRVVPAVIELAAERDQLQATMNAVVGAWNEMAQLAGIVPGTIDHNLMLLGAPEDVEAFRTAARSVTDALRQLETSYTGMPPGVALTDRPLEGRDDMARPNACVVQAGGLTDGEINE